MDELGVHDSEQLQQHLASCSSCADEAARMRTLWNTMGRLGSATANPAASVEFGRLLERRRRSRWWSHAKIAAAVVGLLAAGAALGRFVPGGGPDFGVAPETTEFMLLIRGNEPSRILPEAQLTQEYRAWAEQLAGNGTLVAAEKLVDDEGRWLNAAEPQSENRETSIVGGFFIIRAAGYEEAVDIAGQSPHVRYGGTIEVRAIDRGTQPG
jgi:hypothetical protein